MPVSLVVLGIILLVTGFITDADGTAGIIIYVCAGFLILFGSLMVWSTTGR